MNTLRLLIILLHFSAFIIYLGLIIFVLRLNYRQRLNQLCALILASFAIYSLGHLFFTNASSVAEAHFWVSLSSFGWCTFSIFGLWFSLLFTGRQKWLKNPLIIVVPILLASFFIYQQWAGNLIAGYIEHFYGWSEVWAESAVFVAYSLYYIITVLICAYLIFDFKIKTKIMRKKKGAGLLLSTMLIALSLGALTDTILPSLNVFILPPIGNIAALIWGIGLVSAVKKYDILTITPTLAAPEIISTMEDTVILLDQEQKIVFANRAALEMLEYSEDELLHRSFAPLFKEIEPLAEGSFLEQLLAHKRVKNLKAAYLTQKGKEVPVLLSACVVEKEDEAVGIVITASDLTVYQQMENELKESELRYRTLVEYALVGIGIHQRGKIVYANQRFASMLGYTAAEIADVPIADLISPEERDLILARAQRRLQGFSEPEIYEITLLRKDGNSFQALISNALVNFNGEKATLITISDLTDTKAKRELEIANEELKSFSYSVSHDLRAPLRSIRGFSLALIEDYGDKLEDEAMDYLLRINKAAERMSQLIDDLLQLSRIGQNELNWQKVNLSSIAYDILEELKEKEPERKIGVIIEDDLIVRGDAHLLRIALENLLSNAWKFTKGRPDARIELKAIRKEGKTIYVVQDNGAGFDMQYAQKLFKPFQRLHGQEFEGTGVGLATVKRIINRHGGEIWAEGEVAKGAVFYFTLPESILPD